MQRRFVLSGAVILPLTAVMTARNPPGEIVASLGTNDLDAQNSISSRKFDYRAGRPAVGAARMAAQEWLNAIG